MLKQGQYWRHLPAPTLVTHPAMPATDLAHPVENRPLSIEEYKRIQEFPDDWIIEVIHNLDGITTLNSAYST